MNAMIATTTAFPAILDQPSSQAGRRERIDDFRLGVPEVDRFNRLLVRLGRRTAPLDRDQLATAARELRDRRSDPAPPCILLRMRRIPALSRMVADRAWSPANDAVDVAAMVIGYVRGHDDLIPDRLRKVGRLDDAIVIETAWSRLAPEVESYLDFLRLRMIEASLRGCASTAFGFTRTDGEQARAAEAALAAHQRNVRQRSYLPMAVGLFHVH